MKYLRIVLDEKIPVSGAKEGFFRAAYKLRREGTLHSEDARLLEDCLNFLDDNLDLPERFSRSKSKGAWRRNTKGLSWFKAEALEVVEKAMTVSRILSNNGISTTVLRENRIGYIVYEDDQQVVAEPFADTTR